MQAAVEGFLRYLRIERNASPLTLKSYGTDLAGLFEFFRSTAGHLPEPRHVSISQLRAFVAGLHERGYARSTVARRLASLRSFFEYCRREKLADSHPARALRTPRQGRRLPHFQTTDQVAALLEAPAADQPAGLRDRAILETLYSAGLRVSELVALDIGDWDRDSNIALPCPRGGRPVTDFRHRQGRVPGPLGLRDRNLVKRGRRSSGRPASRPTAHPGTGPQQLQVRVGDLLAEYGCLAGIGAQDLTEEAERSEARAKWSPSAASSDGGPLIRPTCSGLTPASAALLPGVT